MEGRKIRQIKQALLICAKENENRPTPTFNQCVSRLCEDAELRIRELEEGYKTIKEILVNDHNGHYDYPDRIETALDFIDEQLGE